MHGCMACVCAPGSLEALLHYLRTHEPPIPVASTGLGPVHKREVVIASTMLEHHRECVLASCMRACLCAVDR